jgi:diguanylate cyclase (GGDEF)-like protein
MAATNGRDGLTGLHTGSVLEARLRVHLEQDRRQGALALIDIDNFLSINQRCGREDGDRVLREIGHLLEEAGRSAGVDTVVARMRGDEFAMFFPDRDADDAFAILEDTRRKAEQAKLGCSGEDGPRVTISAGIAASPRDATGVADLLRKAEDGLWRAKKGNRNRVGLPSDERMVLKSTYYATGQLERLSALAAQRHTTEASLLREALDDLLRKFADQP